MSAVPFPGVEMQRRCDVKTRASHLLQMLTQDYLQQTVLIGPWLSHAILEVTLPWKEEKDKRKIQRKTRFHV